MSPCGRKGILRHHNYQSDPKLGPGIIWIIIIPWSCHACTTILSLSWYSKIKEVFNQPRYVRVYNCKFSQILDCHKKWIIIIYSDDGIGEEDYEHINQNILDGNVMKMSLVIMEDNYCAIASDDSSCHGNYIIKMSLSPYTLQENFSIYGQVISSG